MKKAKLLKKLLAGSKNVSFSDAVAIAKAFGFHLDRINGDIIYSFAPMFPNW